MYTYKLLFSCSSSELNITNEAEEIGTWHKPCLSVGVSGHNHWWGDGGCGSPGRLLIVWQWRQLSRSVLSIHLQKSRNIQPLSHLNLINHAHQFTIPNRHGKQQFHDSKCDSWILPGVLLIRYKENTDPLHHVCIYTEIVQISGLGGQEFAINILSKSCPALQ